MSKAIPDISIIQKIADAYAYAEGFYVPNSRPARNNNPIDLELDITGEGIGKDGPYIIYPTIEAGWKAAYKLVSLQFHGSHIYTPNMTILEVASHFTTDVPPGAQKSWATNVAKRLGVTPDTKLIDIR